LKRAAFLSLFCLASVAAAQTQPATQPHRVIAPSGFVRFETAGRSFITSPEDRDWVTEAAGKLQSPPPSTRPADLVDRLTAQRDAVKKNMLTDLPPLTSAQVDTFFDSELIPLARESAAVGPRLVYIVAPMDRMKQALRDGWSDPRLHFNRTNDKIEFTRPIELGLPGEVDESVLLLFFQPTAPADERQKDLDRNLALTDAKTDDTLITRAVSLMIGRISGFIAKGPLAGLPRGEDQIWFADGLSTVLAAKYVASIHGAPLSAFIREIISAPIDRRVQAAAIDLLHPMPADALRDDLVLPYAAARHEKNTAVMYLWLINGGDQKIGQTLDDIKKLAPADGETLAKIVASASGVDLLKALRPK